MAAHNFRIPKWNIIFLIYAKLGDAASETSYDPNLLKETCQYLRQLKKEIREIPLSANYNVWIVENVIYLKNKVKVSDHTYLSLMVHNARKPTINRFSIIKKYNNSQFLEKSSCVKTAFKEIETHFIAENNLLITWDHGSAFGIFKSIVTPKPSAAAFKTFFRVISQHPVLSNKDITFNLVQNNKFPATATLAAGGGSDVSGEDGMQGQIEDILTNEELAKAITGGFKKKVVDVLIMFNCFMQNMHTCYALKDCVTYLVAPEGIIAEPGYDYTLILKAISNYRAIAPQKVAEIAITTMRAKFIREGKKDKFEEHAMFAVDLSNYDKLIELMTSFVRMMRDDIASNALFKANTRLSRRPCYEFDLPLTYKMIDFINWLIRLESIVRTASVAAFRNEFLSVYQGFIKASDIGNNIYTVTTRKSWERNMRIKPKGVSIYFRTSKPLKTDPVVTEFIFPGAKFRTSLLQATGWLDFLTELYTR